MKKFLIIFLIILAIIDGGLTYQYFVMINHGKSLLNKTGIEPMYQCDQDSDCISVPGIPCGCSSGGGNTAINKDYQTAWTQKKARESKGFGCMAVISQDWSCSAKAKCVNYKCELVK